MQTRVGSSNFIYCPTQLARSRKLVYERIDSSSSACVIAELRVRSIDPIPE